MKGKLLELDDRGLNAAIDANILSDEAMRELGFTDYSKVSWYFCRRAGVDVTFNVSIPKDGGRLKIDVLDEDFGQPYDYQNFLLSDPSHSFALNVKESVERYMMKLTEAGVITGWEQGDYI